MASSGPGTLVQPQEAVAGAYLSQQPRQSTHPAPPQRTFRRVAVRWGVLAALLLVYKGSLGTLHGLIGNPAFLLGLGICIAAAAWLGVRGALVAILAVALIDRGIALQLSESPETGLAAAVISLLVKLVLAGGLGLVVDSRRRALALNAELSREIEAREQLEESLRHSECLQRALVESLGEGVGLSDAQGRLVFANQALAGTLGVTRDELSTRTFSEFLTGESQSALAATTPNVGERRSYEVVLERNPSTLLLVTETRFEPNGSHDQLTLRVARDLTDRVVTERRQRDLERELQRSQALQSLAVMAGGVAHDEPAVRLVTGRMLSELGHQVVTADSGRRGVELLKKQPDGIDLVLLDLTMPEQSGEHTLGELRVVRSNIPVVITSGFQAEDASALLQMPNVVGFLDKPHTMTSLEMLIAATPSGC